MIKYIKKIFSRKKSKIIVICGATATGKTSLSIEIAKKYNGEIISADSRQVYLGLDIGTAKVTKDEMQGVPHHMIDVADPKNRYTVQEFVTQAKKNIDDILDRGKTPIVCGGTGQYIDALVFNKSFPEVPPNNKLREELERLDAEALFQQLQLKDPQRAKTIDSQNKVRLVRALEIIDALGKVPKQQQSPLYDVLFIGLDIKNDELHKRIHSRIIDRLENQGMIKEARLLHTQGVSYKRMEELGLEYRFMARFLQGKISRDELVEQLYIATRQFAKRQRTWFKRNKYIHWFIPQINQKEILLLVKKFLR